MTGVKWTALGRRISVILAVVLAAFAAATSSPAQPLAQTPATVLKSCSGSFTHAVIGGVEKCLRAGEFCVRRSDSQYRRYGYRCIRFYANVQRYRLTHA
ncbi:MAG: hypothetical protein H0W90_04270 [Actinobacteria bacterium]|nr:hypothetical protein [Actinomycetota bacterium]